VTQMVLSVKGVAYVKVPPGRRAAQDVRPQGRGHLLRRSPHGHGCRGAGWTSTGASSAGVCSLPLLEHTDAAASVWDSGDWCGGRTGWYIYAAGAAVRPAGAGRAVAKSNPAAGHRATRVHLG
jgi:hypothetical protein